MRAARSFAPQTKCVQSRLTQNQQGTAERSFRMQIARHEFRNIRIALLLSLTDALGAGCLRHWDIRIGFYYSRGIALVSTPSPSLARAHVLVDNGSLRGCSNPNGTRYNKSLELTADDPARNLCCRCIEQLIQY
jgi:hypothetical protein